MITHQQLRIYRFAEGYIEMVFREGTEAEKELMLTNDTWDRTEELVQMAHRLECAPLTPEVAAELQAHIQHHTADEATRRLLRQLGRAYPRIRPPWPVYWGRTVLGFTLIGLAVLFLLLKQNRPLALLLLLGLLYLLLGDSLIHWLKS